MKKNILFLLLVFATVYFSSCSKNEEIVNNNDSSDNVIQDVAMLNFINDVDKINEDFHSTKTKSISMDDVSNASQWFLVSIVADGLGGAAGGLIGSGVASTAYSKYLDYVKDQVRSTRNYRPDIHHKHINIYNDSKYKKLEQNVSFVFCDGVPQNSLDSIGYRHNQLLNKLDANVQNYLTPSGNIDYIALSSETRKIAAEMGYISDCAEYPSDETISKMCRIIVKSLSTLPVDRIAKGTELNEIETSLIKDAEMTNNEAKFIRILAQHITSSLVHDVTTDNIIAYSKELNRALKQSKLSDRDIMNVKKFFQVAMCSSLYWHTQKIN